MNKELLQEMIHEGYVQVQKHPLLDLYIYNYSAKAQYDRVWNEVTLACRGLILDAEMRVLARPFAKFFNLGEHENQIIPNETFEVYEKMDGSLGILYWFNGEPFIATRGSFNSEQAQKANMILKNKYADAIQNLSTDKTYLFEIIYPQNRIVVDYGTREELVLLAVINNETGMDEPLADIGFPMAKRYDGINDIQLLKGLQEENREGFVIKYNSGLRYKVKFEEYLRIHRIVTQVSTINIWEYLRAGMPFNDILDRVPDEFYQWVKVTKESLETQFALIEAEAKAEFKPLENRKETALYFMTCKHPSVLFHLLDGRDYKDAIWKQLRPAYERPFANESENE
jgi:T4 RnlA family RNA ligase